MYSKKCVLTKIIPQVKYDLPCEIQILNLDCLEGVLDLKNKGFNPVLLNMCNPDIRGGFYNIVGSQEEDLIRRGDYLETLKTISYPLKTEEAIYSENVKFYRKGLRNKYQNYDKHQIIDIIACAAVKNNNPGIYLATEDESVMKYKIRLIFEIAQINGHDSLVLSAFGCGGFRCPPEHVSKLFKEEIEKWKFSFRCITFCIWDENYPKSNYSIFKNTFSTGTML